MIYPTDSTSDPKTSTTWTTKEETSKNQHLQGAGPPPRHTTYTWWMLQKMEMAMEQRRMALRKSLQNTDVSGAAPNPATAETVIPAREIILPRTAPKNTKTSRIRHRKMEKTTLMREWQSERSRTITTCLPPNTRQASATMNSSYHRTPPNKSDFNAGF